MVQIRCRQAYVIQIQHARPWPLHQPQRIDLRHQVPAIAIHLNQARDRSLLLAADSIGWHRVRGHARTGGYRLDDWCVGPLARRTRWEGIKVGAPRRVNRVRVGQVPLIERFNIGGIGPGQRLPACSSAKDGPMEASNPPSQ